MPGNDRQPSSPTMVSSETETISGLMKTTGGSSSRPPATPASTMKMRSLTPTWIAAMPAPLAANIVSAKSAQSERISSVTSATGTVSCRRRGSGNFTMGRTGMETPKRRLVCLSTRFDNRGPHRHIAWAERKCDMTEATRYSEAEIPTDYGPFRIVVYRFGEDASRTVDIRPGDEHVAIVRGE